MPEVEAMRVRLRRVGAWVLGAVGVLGVLGCYPVYTQPGAETSGSSSGGTTVQSVTSGGVGVTTGSAGTGSSSGSSSSGSSSNGGVSSGSSGAGSTFIVPESDFGDLADCDTFVQDCPPGFKCTYYAGGGGVFWDSTKCVEVMEDPVGPGEMCFVVENGVSGIDNCEKGAMCWGTDAENIGTCVPLCSGTWEMIECPPGWAVYYARAGFCFCERPCDPLTQDCSDGDVCTAAGDEFFCLLDASGEEGQVHDPCEYANSCDPGLICLNSTAAVECDLAASGCCEPFCDLSKPNTCPGQGQLCNPYYEEPWPAPQGYEDVGYCAVPP